MEKLQVRIEGNQIDLELIKKEDKQEYYQVGFACPDKEIDYYTGNEGSFTEEQVFSYVDKIVEDENRYDFKILSKAGVLMGESVLNEIDYECKSANFRICMFNSSMCGKGLGSEAVDLTIKFGMEKLKLHRIELEVYSYNERAYKAYLKSGFKKEGVKRDGAFLNGKYTDVILMSILDRDYENR